MSEDIHLLLGVKTTPNVKEVADKGGEGIKKKREKKRSKEEKAKKKKERLAQALEAVRGLISNETAIIEIEKKKFTTVKDEFNILVRLRRRDDERTQVLYDEAGPIYRRVIELYDALFIERDSQLVNMTKDEDDRNDAYSKVKRKLINAQAEQKTLDEQGINIAKKWAIEREKQIPAREKANRLSSAERHYLKNQAELYKTLYDEATQNLDRSLKVSARVTKYANRKAKLKAEKQLLQDQLNAFNNETIRLKAQLSTFKSRNAYVLKSLDDIFKARRDREEVEGGEIIMQVEEEPVIEIVTEKEREMSVDLLADLSETDESVVIVENMNDIRDLLVKGNFTTLSERFNQPYQELFLAPLIRMYQQKRVLAIQEEALKYIGLLLDTRGEVIATLYEMLLQRKTPEAMIEYLENEGVEVPELQKKLNHLIEREPLLTKAKLLAAINRFIYDEEDEEEDEDKEDEDAGFVELIENEKGDMQIVENRVIYDVAEVIREAFKVKALMKPYEVLNSAPITEYSNRACIYSAKHRKKGTSLIVKITPFRNNETDKTEAQIHQLLGATPGFVRLETYSELAHFPSEIFNECSKIFDPYEKVFLYVMQDVPLSFSDAVGFFNIEDKFCFLFEVLEALYTAKLKHGIEYNNLSLANIRFEEVEHSRFYVEFDTECQSPYRATLIDFGFATIDPMMSQEQRSRLSGEDFNAIYNLINLEELEIFPRITASLNNMLDEARRRSNRASVSFPDLIRLLISEKNQ